jgi:hypothetical protein
VTREAYTAGTDREKKRAMANVSEQFSLIRFIRYYCGSIVALIFLCVEQRVGTPIKATELTRLLDAGGTWQYERPNTRVILLRSNKRHVVYAQAALAPQSHHQRCQCWARSGGSWSGVRGVAAV